MLIEVAVGNTTLDTSFSKSSRTNADPPVVPHASTLLLPVDIPLNSFILIISEISSFVVSTPVGPVGCLGPVIPVVPVIYVAPVAIVTSSSAAVAPVAPPLAAVAAPPVAPPEAAPVFVPVSAPLIPDAPDNPLAAVAAAPPVDSEA